jgi:predicted acylesterase/phospholipase RssA
MKAFRKNVAIAIDGGGIRGVVVTKALSMLEEALGKPLKDVARLTAGTSTGSIISAGIGAGLTAARMHELYLELGRTIFKTTWRSVLWPLTKYRYASEPLATALYNVIGNMKMGDFWTKKPPFDIVITSFDLQTNRTRFIKPWKTEYKNWPVVTAVMASGAAPTFFPAVEGRYVDGGVGAYYNPCFLAAYEAQFCLKWDADETTLISIGTGRNPPWVKPGQSADFWAWQWIGPLEDGFLDSTNDQQVHLVETFFKKLDFRRFQVDLQEPIDMDEVSKMDALVAYGEQLGEMILHDQFDRAQGILPPVAEA